MTTAVKTTTTRQTTTTDRPTEAATITHYADPFSPWTRGFQPILEELRKLYGDQVRIDIKMGGMARNISQWIEEQQLDQNSVREWITGVSDLAEIEIDDDYLAKTGVKTTWVGALAFTAAMKHDSRKAVNFLNRMTTGFQVETQPATRDTIAEFAQEVGLDGARIVTEAFHESVISQFAWERNAMERSELSLDSLQLSFGGKTKVVEKEFSVNAYEEILEQIAPGIRKLSNIDQPEVGLNLDHAV